MNKNKLIDLVKRLIAIKSVAENKDEKKKIIDFVESYFDDCDVKIKKFEIDGIYSIMIYTNDENPEIILNGHLDVVDAKQSDFDPVVRGNKLYGRGSGDMKTGCAVMMEVVKEFSKAKNIPSIGLLLTTDEELGGARGVGAILEKENYKPKVVVIPDGGVDLSTVIVKQKGILHVKVKAFGKSAHGARPFLGENAIEKLVAIYQDIKKKFPDLEKDEWSASMNLGRIVGGEAINKVPDYAEMYLDFRLTKPGERDQVLGEIKSVTDDVEIIAEGIPFNQDEEDKYVKMYKNIAESRIGKNVKLTRVEGASDARYFTEGKNSVIITKINCRNIHSDNEWVDLNEAMTFYEILSEFIKKIGR